MADISEWSTVEAENTHIDELTLSGESGQYINKLMCAIKSKTDDIDTKTIPFSVPTGEEKVLIKVNDNDSKYISCQLTSSTRYLIGTGDNFVIRAAKGTPKNAGDLVVSAGFVAPQTSATGMVSLGTSDRKWKEVVVEEAEIDESDLRAKDNVEETPEALMRAWGKVNFKIFQKKKAIAKKGSEARIHVGVIAQEIEEAFSSEGLDARKYGLFCYDEWDDLYDDVVVVDKQAVYDSNGNIAEHEESHVERVLVREAGNAFAVRYTEALALECAYQRWRLQKIEERLNGNV